MAHRTHAQHLASKLNLRPRPILVRPPQAQERPQLTPQGSTSTSASPLLSNSPKQAEMKEA